MSMHKQFFQILDIFASQSKCVSHKVACLATKNNRIVATGINGTGSGYINCCDKFPLYNPLTDREQHHKWSLIHEHHSEVNLIGDAVKRGISLDGCIIYCNLCPCSDCMKLLIASGIKYIMYLRTYDKADPASLEYAKSVGVTVEQYKEN